MKPPDNDPPRITQADEIINAGEDGLENLQVESTGRKPVPVTEMSEPARAVDALKTNTGCAWIGGRCRLSERLADTLRRMNNARATPTSSLIVRCK